MIVVQADVCVNRQDALGRKNLSTVSLTELLFTANKHHYLSFYLIMYLSMSLLSRVFA